LEHGLVVGKLHVVVLAHSSLHINFFPRVVLVMCFSDDDVSGRQFVDDRVSRHKLNNLSLLVGLVTSSNVSPNV